MAPGGHPVQPEEPGRSPMTGPDEPAGLPAVVDGAGPPVLLLHAGIADHTMFDGLVDELRRDHTVIRYDLRGFGRSPAPTADFDHVDDAAAVLDRLGLTRVSVVGNSFGGMVGLRFTARHPERVTRLLLLATAAPDWDRWSPQAEQYAAAEEAALAAGDLDAALRLDLETWVRGSRPDWTPRLRALADQIRPAALVALRRQAETSDHERPSPALAPEAIRVPTTVGVADADLPDFGAMGRHLASHIPGARLVEFADSGHLIPLEHPSRVAEVLRAGEVS